MMITGKVPGHVDHSWYRRCVGAAFALATATGSCAPSPASPAAKSKIEPPKAAAIVSIAGKAMENDHLRAVIIRVTTDGRNIVTKATGVSANGVPASPDMHFRYEAVAISYMATLPLQLVDDGVVTLDAPLSTWLPELPNSDQVTLRMLATMTAGYPDYVRIPSSSKKARQMSIGNGPPSSSSGSVYQRPVFSHRERTGTTRIPTT